MLKFCLQNSKCVDVTMYHGGSVSSQLLEIVIEACSGEKQGISQKSGTSTCPTVCTVKDKTFG